MGSNRFTVAVKIENGGGLLTAYPESTANLDTLFNLNGIGWYIGREGPEVTG